MRYDLFLNSIRKMIQTTKVFSYRMLFPNKCGNHCKPRTRRPKITWLNPPYNVNVKTKIDVKLLKMVEKHFSKNHALYKIFN